MGALLPVSVTMAGFRAVILAVAFASASAFNLPLSSIRPASIGRTAAVSVRPVLAGHRRTGAVALSAIKQVPHGGKELVDLMITDDAKKAEAAKSCDFEHQLTERQLCDVELICNGGLSPITGFMNEATYKSVVDDMKLPDGTIFGLPIIFDTDDDKFVPGKKVLLKQGDLDIATFTIEDRFKPDKVHECFKCYGETTLEHPGTLMVATERGSYYCGGKLEGLNKPVREFECRTPKEVRANLPEDKDVVAFQCRNPVHRAHYELFTRALDAPEVGKDAVVLVHPTCGPTQADDIPGTTRYKTYVRLAEETANPRTKWDYLPYSMHMAGPREAIQHILIRKNFGCTHFIIGRDMAGSKSCLDGEDFYGAFDAQEFATEHGEELNMKLVPSANLVYTEEEGYILADEAKAKGIKAVKLSGTEFRRRLRAGEDIPEWFAFKSVVEVLRESVANDE